MLPRLYLSAMSVVPSEACPPFGVVSIFNALINDGKLHVSNNVFELVRAGKDNPMTAHISIIVPVVENVCCFFRRRLDVGVLKKWEAEGGVKLQVAMAAAAATAAASACDAGVAAVRPQEIGDNALPFRCKVFIRRTKYAVFDDLPNIMQIMVGFVFCYPEQLAEKKRDVCFPSPPV